MKKWKLEDIASMSDAELEELNDRMLFVSRASPSSWLEHADELRDAAELLWNDQSNGIRAEAHPFVEIEEVREGNIVKEVPVTRSRVTKYYSVSRPYILLAGFAVENLVKGILIAENPALITSGKLSGEIRTHKLVKLLRKIDAVACSDAEIHFAEVASKAIPYWGRYPIPLEHTGVVPEVGMDDGMREAYLSLHDRLGFHLYRSIKNGWDSGVGAMIVQLHIERYEKHKP